MPFFLAFRTTLCRFPFELTGTSNLTVAPFDSTVQPLIMSTSKTQVSPPSAERPGASKLRDVPELRDAILSLLPTSFLLRARQVSRDWHAATVSSPTCRRTLFLKPVDMMDTWKVTLGDLGRLRVAVDVAESHQRTDTLITAQAPANDGTLTIPSVTAVQLNP